MNQAIGTLLRITAWMLALALVALPVVAVVNGWIGGERWPLRTLRVNDGLQQVDQQLLREAVLPHAQRGFFAVKLPDAQAAIERLPWVDEVSVRKRWPDVLEVHVVEHRPFARWGEGSLLSVQGRVFPAEGIEPDPALPLLHGPDARSADVMALYNEASELFAARGFAVQSVSLDNRGSWSLQLGNGTQVVLGSQEARLRLRRFARVLPQLLENQTRVLQRADLRYTNGFALEWANPGLGIRDSGFEKAGGEALMLHPMAALPNPPSRIPNPGSQS